MSTPRLQTFQAFWPFYLGEHRLPLTRWLHFVGSTLAVGIAVGSVVTQRWSMLPFAAISGYGFAWVSHFLIEKNRPATFTYPLWSLAADWKMWALMLTRRLDPELARHGVLTKAEASLAR